jgi:inorganic pyrophosphatase
MMNPWHDLETGPNPPDELTVVVEIPRGSRNKYELDKETGMYRLDRVLYSAVHYPGDYGFFPRTYAEDDDPLDALIMVSVPTLTGCLVEVRPVGLFRMKDKGEMDEKILCVPTADPLYDGIETLDDVPGHYLREVEHFFAVYKDLEGARVETLGWEGAGRARSTISEAMQRYQWMRRRDAEQPFEPETRAGIEL